MAVEILRISLWVLGLLHFDAIRLYLRLTELFFLLLLPRRRLRFLILHLTIVYLPSVLNPNDFFPYLVLQNPTHITINIQVLLRLSVFLLLAITLFLILVLIRFYLSLCLPFFMSRSRFRSGVTGLFQVIPSPQITHFFSLGFLFYPSRYF